MTETLKCLAQATPSANTTTTFYTVPSSTSVVISSIVICNTNSSAVNFSIAYSIGGASLTTAQYLYYQLPLLANDTFVATIGISMATTDVIYIIANSNGVAFNAFGVQVA